MRNVLKLAAVLSAWAGTGVAEDVNLYDYAENCLSTVDDRKSCFPEIHCETALFQSEYGFVEGAGAGWCAANTRDFWLKLISRAEVRYSEACLRTDEHRLIFEGEGEAWLQYLHKRCELYMLQPRFTVQNMQTAWHFCYRDYSLRRMDDIAAREANCASRPDLPH